MKKASELLTEAKSLITNPTKWTQGYYARDLKGDITEAVNSNAVCFCSIGALHKVNPSLYFSDDDGPEQYLNKASGIDWIVQYNDEHTHEEVMKVWDKAIKMAVADEQALEVEA